MKVKRFSGRTAGEAMAAARLELGPDAVILDSKRETKGILGALGRGQFTVLAALEEVDKSSSFAEQLEVAGRTSRGSQNSAQAAAVLLQQGVDPGLAFEMLEKAPAASSSEMLSLVLDSLMSGSTARPAYEKGMSVALVGPTGSGKTTTAAKILAIAALKLKMKCHWIAADTFRVGGVEQARTYADIMDIPLSVCTSASQVSRARTDHKEAEFTVIDTSGRSYLDREQVESVAQLIRESSVDEVHLTVPAATGWVEVQDILSGFQPAGYQRLCITKVDEASRAGTILNLAGLGLTPMVYFTTGQVVPDDICPANSESVMELMNRRRRS